MCDEGLEDHKPMLGTYLAKLWINLFKAIKETTDE